VDLSIVRKILDPYLEGKDMYVYDVEFVKEFGYQILPDVQNGAGPIYFSLIHKINSITS